MSQRLNRRVRLLSGAAVGAAAFVAVGAAQAQTATTGQQADQAPTEVGEIVVTGIRASQTQSINVKRNETALVDAISAEDIGKLPDVTVADALQRIAGIMLTQAFLRE